MKDFIESLNILTSIPEQTRALLYRVITAVVLLAGLYGLVNEEQAAGWVALAGALFSGAMASSNTSRQLPAPDPSDRRDIGSAAAEQVLTIAALIVIFIGIIVLIRVV